MVTGSYGESARSYADPGGGSQGRTRVGKKERGEKQRGSKGRGREGGREGEREGVRGEEKDMGAMVVLEMGCR